MTLLVHPSLFFLTIQVLLIYFFFQAEDGIRDIGVTGVQTCALPISLTFTQILLMNFGFFGIQYSFGLQQTAINPIFQLIGADLHSLPILNLAGPITEIGRASCRERV